MPDADRLQELRRQRALVQEQLAWLDREIAALSAPAPAPVSVPPAAVPRSAPASTRPVARTLADISPIDADAMIAKLAAEEGNRGAISKQGCWIAFLGVMAFLVLAVGTLMHFLYR